MSAKPEKPATRCGSIDVEYFRGKSIRRGRVDWRVIEYVEKTKTAQELALDPRPSYATIYHYEMKRGEGAAPIAGTAFLALVGADFYPDLAETDNQTRVVHHIVQSHAGFLEAEGMQGLRK